MYELRSYDGFQKIGHPESSYRMDEGRSRKLKHGYYASVSYIDALLGDLISHMKKIGIYENTIIILSGDHGWKLGDHNSWGKMTNYNIDLKVPMIIRYPNQENAGTQTFEITELIDMFPSLCELAGIDIPDYVQGTSFVPLIKEPERPWKKDAYSQFHRRPRHSMDGNRYMGYSINTKKFHYIEWYTWNPKTGTRGELKSIELFDRLNDPNETVNIAGEKEFSEVMEDLSEQLADGWQKAIPN
jgi:iduronate 2-sulfatase